LLEILMLHFQERIKMQKLGRTPLPPGKNKIWLGSATKLEDEIKNTLPNLRDRLRHLCSFSSALGQHLSKLSSRGDRRIQRKKVQGIILYEIDLVALLKQ
jgi:hypothetical protein